MDHQEAIQKYAAEGYLLDELTEAERDAFEEHFADCEDCFAHVRDGLRFATVLPAVAVTEEPAPVSIWQRFAPLAAAASFAVFVPTVVYQHIQLAEAREPRIVRIESVADVRDVRKTLQGPGPFNLEFKIPPTHPSPRYQCAIVDAQGRRIGVPDTVPAAQADQVDLQIPRGLLSRGNYSLVVTGTGGVPVNQIEFTVR
jgi:hypothetical protein